MRKSKYCKGLMAMMLSVIMVTGMIPVSVEAMDVRGEVISFEELSSEVIEQSVPLGTSKSELNLPEALTALVRFASASEQEEGAGAEEEDASQPVTMDIPVTWTASPEYDGSTADKYIFTTELPEGFTFAGDVELPTITVTVEETVIYGEITEFDELEDEIRWQNTASPNLPDMLSGTVEGEVTEIPVIWEADHEYDEDSPEKGLYVFTAKIDAGYTIGDGVEMPHITVYIPAVQRKLMSMAGSGTSDSELEITTAAQLSEIAALVNAGRLETFLFNDSEKTVYLSLGNDIDLSTYGKGWNDGKGWVPIGMYFEHPFKGTFNGNGNAITGLYINDSDLELAGLFGHINGGTVKNLGIVDVNITAGSTVGGLASYVLNDGTVQNCYVTGEVTGSDYVGGLIGMVVAGSSVTNCYATCSITGYSYIGGVTSLVVSSSVTDCYTTCTVTGTGNCVGGVVGQMNAGNVGSCYSSGMVSGSNYVGGIVGQVYNSGTVQNCSALNPSIVGTDKVGRVACGDSIILSGNCAFSDMTVTVDGSSKAITSDEAGTDGADIDATTIKQDGTLGERCTTENGWTVEDGRLPGVGGTVEMPDHIVGGRDSNFRGEGTPENPYQISTAEQLAKLAELVNKNNATYNSAYYKLTADIDLSAYGKDYDGGKGWMPIGYFGFKGNFNGGDHIITGLYINRPTAQTTGLFSIVEDGTIENLGVVCADITGDGNVGGIAGDTVKSRVTNCYVTGSVIGTDQAVGGVVGYVYGKGSIVTNCYSTCTVTSEKSVGGIVGSIILGSVQRCYSTGAVLGKNYGVGGVAGKINCGDSGNVSVQNCAALNPSLNAVNYVNRVVGDNTGSLTPSGNVAFSGMTVNGSIVTSGNAASLHGEDKDANAIAGTGFFEDLFGSDPAWVYAEGKLPILAGFAEGTQSSAIPYYMSGSYFGGGDGSSEEQAYEISTALQLTKLAELVNEGNVNYNDKYYKLAADIDLSDYNASNTDFNSGKGWVPIGKYSYNSGDYSWAFDGVFDGDGHTVTGLYINDSTDGISGGLFGCITGTVKNLNVTNTEITLGSSDQNSDDCYIGGVVGYVHEGRIMGCHVSGILHGLIWSELGGIAGCVDGGRVTDCDASVTVTGNGFYVGGVVGYLIGKGEVVNCRAIGTIKGCMFEGGIVGDSRDGSITNCYSGCTVSGAGEIGGVVGRIGGYSNKTGESWSGTVENCYSTGSVSGSGFVGGIVADLEEKDSKVVNCYSTGPVSGTGTSVGYIGGVVGYMNNNSKAQNCYATGTVSGTGSKGRCDGGIVGAALYGSNIVNCAALNPSVSSTGTVGRVLGKTYLGATSSGNYAFSRMTGGGNDKTASGLDGEDITIAQMNTASFWTTASNWENSGWDENIWDIQDGKLPILKNMGGIPQSGDGGLYLSERDIQYATVTLSDNTYTYNGMERVPALTVTFDSVTLVQDTDYTYEIASTDGEGTSAGTQTGTVELKLSGKGNYNGTKFVTYTINKAAAPTIVWPAATAVTYGAKLSDSMLTGGSTTYGSFSWVDGDTVPTAGNGSYSVTFTPNTTTMANYETITETTKTIGITVNKASAPTISPQVVSIYRRVDSADNTINLAALLPTDCGETSYNITSTNTLVQHASVNTSGILSFDTLSSDSVTTEIVTVKAEMLNYQDTVLTVTVNFVDKKESVVTPSVSGTLGYGQILSALTISATALADNGTTLVSGSIAWDNPTSKPTVGTLTQSWTFTPTDLETYEIEKGTADITVNKAIPQGTPAIKKISSKGKTLSDAVLTGNFTNPYDGSSVPGILSWNLPDTTDVTRDMAYSWTFTPDDTANYSVRTGSLTPYPKSTSGGSFSVGNSTTATPVTVPEKRPDQPVTVSASVTATTGTNGTTGAVITDKVITDAITKAQSEAKAQGKTANGIAVVLNITAPQGIKATFTTLSQNALKALVDSGVSSLEINGLPVSMSFDREALQTIQSQSSGDVTITAVSGQDLSDSAKAMIGERPVYNITVGYTINGSTATVANFSGGTATVSIPYTPANGESIGCLYAVYVDGKGSASRINDSAYDANSGSLIFTTDHFSIYGVGYTAPSAKFTDTSKHWAVSSIDYVVGRGLLDETSRTTFSPDAPMTRGTLVTALGRLAEADVSGYQTSSFTDVKTGSFYLPYIEWAYKNSIIQGIGNSQFDPDRAVTREEIAAIFANYAKAAGYTLPVIRVAVNFEDGGSIGSTYKTAVMSMQQAGIMLGENNDRFNPKASATRAEVSVMLCHYIKLTIDPATAKGWAKNDSGQRMYFKDGKVLTGWQTIDDTIYCFNNSGNAYADCWHQNSKGEWFYLSDDGSAVCGWKDIGGHRYYFSTDAVMIGEKWLEIDGKWYFFYAEGSLAVSTTIDGFKIDKNGIRQAS